MILNINVQIFYFLSNILAGLIVGVLFDIYRVIRGFKSPNKVLTAISDILFWILAALLTFIFMLVTNNVNIRYYTFVALFIGLYGYFNLISKKFIDILRIIIYYFIKLLRFSIRLIIMPFILIRILCNNIIYLMKVNLNKIFKKGQEKTI